jgi:two-component system, cell cycle response regulator
MGKMDRWSMGQTLEDEGPTRVDSPSSEMSPALGGAPVGATMTVIHGGGARQMYYVDETGGALGRGDEVEFRMTNSTVSRFHARLEFGDGQIFLEDLGSTNGTFVDDRQIRGRVRLPTSCRIRLGLYTVLQFIAVDEGGANAYQKLQRAMFVDTLTGAGNRRYLNRRLEEELSFGVRHYEPVGVLLADLDHFKRINDTWGHTVGDRVLAAVSKIFEAQVRTEDSIYRYGGEEFCILVRGVESDGLEVMAERVRAAVEQFEMQVDEDRVQVTVSVGVACVVPGDPDDPQTLAEGRRVVTDASKHRIVTIADQALYRAKTAGRNRVVMLTTSA